MMGIISIANSNISDHFLPLFPGCYEKLASGQISMSADVATTSADVAKMSDFH